MSVDNAQRRLPRGLSATLAVTLVCLLTGCGNIWGYTHADGSGGGFIENIFRSPSASTSTPSSGPKQASIPSGAYPGAGEKRIPSGAIELASSPTRNGGTAPIFRSQTGNIICQNIEGKFGCGIVNYFDDKPYGVANGEPLWWIDFSAEEARLTTHETPETFTQTDAVLLYNTSVYSGNIVCGATEKGVTCWDHTTGHGAFMSRGSYTTF